MVTKINHRSRPTKCSHMEQQLVKGYTNAQESNRDNWCSSFIYKMWPCVCDIIFSCTSGGLLLH